MYISASTVPHLKHKDNSSIHLIVLLGCLYHLLYAKSLYVIYVSVCEELRRRPYIVDTVRGVICYFFPWEQSLNLVDITIHL